MRAREPTARRARGSGARATCNNDADVAATVLHSTGGCRSDLVAEGCSRVMFESFEGILWYPGLFNYMVSDIFQNV